MDYYNEKVSYVNNHIIIKDIEFNQDFMLNFLDKWLQKKDQAKSFNILNCNISDEVYSISSYIPELIGTLKIENCCLTTSGFAHIVIGLSRFPALEYVSFKNNNIGEKEEYLLRILSIYDDINTLPLKTFDLTNNNIRKEHFTKKYLGIDNLIWQ